MSDNTGQVGDFQVGTGQVGAGANDQIAFVGFTRRAFGTVAVGDQVAPTGFSRRAFGSATVQEQAASTGFSRRAFGSLTVQEQIEPTGFSTQAFGTATVQEQIAPTGFSTRAFGTAGVNLLDSPDGFSRQAFGVPTVVADVDVSGFSPRAFGNLTVQEHISPTGFTRRAFGTSSVDLNIFPTGFTRRAFGTAQTSSQIRPDGLSTRAFGLLSFPLEVPGFSRQAFGRVQVGDHLNVDGFTRRAFGGPTLDDIIKFSGFSRRAFGTARFSVNSQVDFFTRGICRRRFGIVGIDGGEQELTAWIKGVDQSGYMLLDSAVIRKQVMQVGTCDIKFEILASDSFRPDSGQSVVINENGRTMFGGMVSLADGMVHPGSSPKMLEYMCKGVDNNYILQRRVVFRDYSPDYLINILNDINTNFLNDEGVFMDGVDPSIYIADPLSFKYVKVKNAFDTIALAVNGIYWIDDFRIVHFISIDNVPNSRLSITDISSNADSIHVIKDIGAGNYRNTQYLRSSQNQLSAKVTLSESHTFTSVRTPDPIIGPDGVDVVLITSYPLTAKPALLRENGINITDTDRFFELKVDGTPTAYPLGGEGWYWFTGANGIWHYPTWQNPTPGTTLEVEYSGLSTYASNVIVYRDAVEIANMKAAMAGLGSGIFEETEDFQGTYNYAQGVALASGIVKSVTPVPVQVKCNTIDTFEGVGYGALVNLADFSVNQRMIIQQYTQTAKPNDLGFGTRFLTNLMLTESKSMGNFASYYERIINRLNAGLIPPATEKPTWTLAADSPGNISDGLLAGKVLASYNIKTDQGRIFYTTAVFDDQPASDIVMDFTVNGVTIYDGLKMRYSPGDWPHVVTYINFLPTPFNVKKDDKVQLIVLSVDAINPGKNGTVSMVITPR